MGSGDETKPQVVMSCIIHTCLRDIAHMLVSIGRRIVWNDLPGSECWSLLMPTLIEPPLAGRGTELA